MGMSIKGAAILLDGRMAKASGNKADAYYDLGVAYSTGSGVDYDLVEAHKWFNLAALAGVREGAALRAEIAGEMSRDDIAEAQRQARAWLASLSARPATRAAA